MRGRYEFSAAAARIKRLNVRGLMDCNKPWKNRLDAIIHLHIQLYAPRVLSTDMRNLSPEKNILLFVSEKNIFASAFNDGHLDGNTDVLEKIEQEVGMDMRGGGVCRHTSSVTQSNVPCLINKN